MDQEKFNKLLRTESVFKDQKTLNAAWVPGQDEKLLCRDEEIVKLTSIHRPILQAKGSFSVNTLVLGNGGIGKTLTIRYFGRLFQQASQKSGLKLTIEYFDCLQHRTKSSILRHISERLHFSGGHGYSDNELMTSILKELKKQNEYLLIILDEIHNIPSNDILALLNASIGFGEQNTRFSIICVCRPTDWYKVETEMIMSRIQDIIRMKPYAKSEAMDILKYRRSLGFRAGVIEDDIIDLISDIVVETENMRHGISIMRSCGIRADELNISEIDSEMVISARNEVTPSFKANVIDSLKLHEQLALWAIARTLKVTKEPYTMVDDAFEFYEMLCEEKNVKPHVKMSFRKYIRSLAGVKVVLVDYLNPTIDKKGRQIQVKLTDITPDKLDELFQQKIPDF